jgi:uncharacterized protein
MPANLTPQYQKVEDEYRRAQTSAERLPLLERMLQLIPKHKGTEKLQAAIKARLSETRAELQRERTAARGVQRSIRLPRQGAATVVIIGAPNAGKSRLLATLTNAHPLVAEYPFSTREPLPGIMTVHDVTVQLIDTPPIAVGHFEPYLVDFVRTADLVLLVMNGSDDDGPDATQAILELLETRHTRLAHASGFEDHDFSLLRIRSKLVVTHGSDPDAAVRTALLQERCGGAIDLPICLVELSDLADCEQLRREIWHALGLLRVYTKSPKQPVERVDPFTLPAGATVEELAAKVHADWAERVRSAKLWGRDDADFRTVGKDHLLSDGDLIELQA